MRQSLLAVTVLVMGVSGSLARESSVNTGTSKQLESKTRLHHAINKLFDTTHGATFKLTSYQKLAEDDEFTAGRVTWLSQQSLRIDVDEGRGKGATAVLKDDRVIAWRRGWLSLFKFRFKLRNKRVMSMRGRDLSNTGFFDDLRFVLDHWDAARVREASAGYIIEYQNDQQLATRMWLAVNPLHVYRHEVEDAGITVERYTYEEIRLNPPIDRKLLDP